MTVALLPQGGYFFMDGKGYGFVIPRILLFTNYLLQLAVAHRADSFLYNHSMLVY